MEYGLTPRAIAVIIFGIALTAFSQWIAFRWRAARESEFGP